MDRESQHGVGLWSVIETKMNTEEIQRVLHKTRIFCIVYRVDTLPLQLSTCWRATWICPTEWALTGLQSTSTHVQSEQSTSI